MPWTTEQKLRELMRQPWTVRMEENADDPSDRYLVARISEVPSAIATGRTQRELAADLWESLRASLETYLEADNQVPRPVGVVLPWERGEEPKMSRVRRIKAKLTTGAWDAITDSQGAATRTFAVNA